MLGGCNKCCSFLPHNPSVNRLALLNWFGNKSSSKKKTINTTVEYILECVVGWGAKKHSGKLEQAKRIQEWELEAVAILSSMIRIDLIAGVRWNVPGEGSSQ